MAEYSVFPSIIPDEEEPFVDNQYQKQELKQKEYPELKSIAAEHPSDEIHGRMSEEDIVDGLIGKERV